MSNYLCHQSHHLHHRLRMTSQRLYGEAAWVPSGLLDSLLAENPVAELLKWEKDFFISTTYFSTSLVEPMAFAENRSVKLGKYFK